MSRNLLVFVFILLFPFIITAQNDAYHDTLKSQLLTNHGLTGGNWIFSSNENITANNAISYGLTATNTIVTGQDFSVGRNLDIANAGTNPWDAGYFNQSTQSIQLGDKILAVIWLKTISTPLGAPSNISIFIEDAITYNKEILLNVNPNTQWQQYLIPFEASEAYPIGDIRLGLHLAYQQQEIEVGGIVMINYGNTVPLSSLPQNFNLGNYPGSDPNATWRVTAQSRIEQHRKANMQIQVQDGQGNPIPNAMVRVEMLRHDFAFGTAITPRRLANNSDADLTYQDKLVNLDGNGHGFNWVVTENALKWRAWEQGWAGTTTETINGIQWLLNNNIKVRGHVLVWPRWGSMPPDMQTNSNDPTYLLNRIDGHLNTILNFAGVRDKVTEWDVINEIAHERDLEYALQGKPGYITGREIYNDIFNKTYQEDSTLTTYLNDYGILNHGSSTNGIYPLYKSMIQEIIDNGANLDGIGFQAHMGAALIAPDSIYAILEDCYQTFGRNMKITEYDQSNLLPDSIQAKYTGDFLTMVFSHPATDGFLMWGFWDGAHWLGNAPLYNSDWTPKATHTIFTDLLFNQWWTDSTLITDATGNLTIRGFKGDYKITTTHNNQEVTAQINMIDDINTTVMLFPVNTEKTLQEVDVRIYPNPVSDYLSLELPYSDKWTVHIINGEGKILYEKTSTDFIQFLDIRKYTSGIYFVKITNKNGKSIVKQLSIIR